MSKYLDNLKQLCRETDICRETARMVLKVNVPELIQEIEKLQSQLARYEDLVEAIDGIVGGLLPARLQDGLPRRDESVMVEFRKGDAVVQALAKLKEPSDETAF